MANTVLLNMMKRVMKGEGKKSPLHIQAIQGCGFQRQHTKQGEKMAQPVEALTLHEDDEAKEIIETFYDTDLI